MTHRAYFMDLPYRVKGYVSKNSDGTYTVILNSRLSYEQNVKTYLHELRHILNGDFDKYDVDKVERWSRNDLQKV